MNISAIAIRRPVFTSMIMVGMMVLGVMSIRTLGVDLFPNVSLPVVVVTTPYPGAGPEEIEQLVTRPIEDALASISGIENLKSYSRDSVSTVIIRFQLETDIKQVGIDVRDKLASVRGRLPAEGLDSIISRVDPTAAPVLVYTVSGVGTPAETRAWVDDKIRPALEQVDGVAAVQVKGGDVREVRVDLDMFKLEPLGLSPLAVARLLGAQNLNIPAGTLVDGQGQHAVRTVGQFQTVDEVAEAPLIGILDQTVRVRDVGRVYDTFEERRLRTRTNGVDSITFAVLKSAGENTVEVVRRAHARLARLTAGWPAGVALTQIIDQSVVIEENARDVSHSIVFGGLMAVLVIFLFMLDWRSTLISALALPTSVVGTFFVMYLMNFTINMMTLLGLSLAIGLLIDDAVVVRENIFRHLEMGKNPFRAAREGTNEIALAVLATTFTVVAVFVPVAFMKGMVGQFFKEFGITVAAAVLISLFVAFTLDPMLSARLVKAQAPGHDEARQRHRLMGPMLRFYARLDTGYRDVLAWSLGHKGPVMAGALAMLVASLGMMSLMGKEFFAPEDRGQFLVSLTLAPHVDVDQTDAAAREAERRIRLDPDIVSVYSVVGSGTDTADVLEANKAILRVIAKDKNARDVSLDMLKARVRERLGTLAGLRITVADVPSIEGAAVAPVIVHVRGDDAGELRTLAAELEKIARSVSGVGDVDSSAAAGKPELQVRVRRDLATSLGVPLAVVGAGLRAAIEGDVNNKLRNGATERNIRVQIAPEQRGDPRTLAMLAFPGKAGVYRLSEIAELTPAKGPSSIEREGRRRQISLELSLTGERSLGDVVSELKRKVSNVEIPDGYEVLYGGLAAYMEDSFEVLGLALGLAIVFIYLVLASQFESLVHPFTIMLSLPLAIVGAFGLLFACGLNLGMAAMIGVILLMGLVTKNAILLVDYTNQLRERDGMGMVDALLLAGPTRLRPILMTSAAMVLGMLPTALGNGAGAEFRRPMSVAVIGGVLTSTFLTLVVVPIVYCWLDRFARKVATEEPEPAAAAVTIRPRLAKFFPGGGGDEPRRHAVGL